MNLSSQRTSPACPCPARREALITSCIALILTVALIYTLGYPVSLRWDLSRYFAFGQLHSLVFTGNALLLLLTLHWMAARPELPRRFRVAGAMLVLAHAFTVLTAVMWVPAYTQTHDVLHAGMLTYVLILLLGNFGLMVTVPWWTWPRSQLLRLIADTLLVMSVIDIALTVALPSIIPGWAWTPALTAAVFRLETSLGLAFWYVTVYLRFGGFRHRALRPWALGIVCLLATDVTLLWGTLQFEQGHTDLLLGAGMPFWMVHQTMWSLGLFYVLDEVPAWQGTPRAGVDHGSRLRWVLSLQQGAVLVAIALSVSMAGSLRATFWFIAALGVSRIVASYDQGREREELGQANARLRALGDWQSRMLQQRQIRAVEAAHDMGNLLQDVKLSISAVAAHLRKKGDPVPSNITDLVLTADTSMDEIDNVLNAMVAAARLDAGVLQLKLVPGDLSAMLATVTQTLQARAMDQRVELLLSVPPDLPLVLCDRNLLARVLRNVIGNAIKFTGAAHENGGRVMVTVRASGERVALTVADNGPGIRPADLERLGQRFVRGSDVPNSLAGFGLGLAFARGIVEQHPGGEFEISSSFGAGTAVTLHLATTGPDNAMPSSYEERPL